MIKKAMAVTLELIFCLLSFFIEPYDVKVDATPVALTFEDCNFQRIFAVIACQRHRQLRRTEFFEILRGPNFSTSSSIFDEVTPITCQRTYVVHSQRNKLLRHRASGLPSYMHHVRWYNLVVHT